MRRLVLLSVFLLSALFSSAQNHNNYVYCELIGTQKLLSTKVTVVVDYGQEQKLFQDQRLRDENGKVKTFNSMIDALNYMSAQGWQFVQAYTVTAGQQNVYHWLLRKELENPKSEKAD